MTVKVNALDHLVINVADVARSAEWYRKVLGHGRQGVRSGPGRTPRTSLMFGNQKIMCARAMPTRWEWFTGRP